MTARDIVHAAVYAVTEQTFTDATALRDIVDSLGLVEIGVEIEAHVLLPADVEFTWETVADAVESVARAMGETR